MSELKSAAGCVTLKASEPFVGKQGFTYAPAISRETVGAIGLHMQLVTMPPGARGKAHKHASHETAIYVLSGRSGTYYGEQLEHHAIAGAGEFLYIPPNTPHLPYNLSQTEPVVAVISRTDPHDQESVILMPELDRVHGGPG